MRYKNKKAVAMDNALPLMVIIVFGAIIFFGFKLVQSKNENTEHNDIERQKDIVNGQELLIEFVTGISDGKSNSDLLREYHAKNDFGFMKKIIEDFFNSKIGHLPGWQFEILNQEGDSLYSVFGGYKSPECLSNIYNTGSVLVPVDQGYIIIRLRKSREVSGYAAAKAC